jgi:hypothetical protein
MRRNLLMSFTEELQGILDHDWTGGMGLDILWGFYYVYFVKALGQVKMPSARVFTTSGDKPIEGGVSPCTALAVRLFIGHYSIVRLIMSCGGVCIGFDTFCGVSLIYIALWRPMGSAPKGRDDVIVGSQ